MLRDAHWDRARVGLVLTLILVLAGIVLDTLFSASRALDDSLLVAAAAVILLVLLGTHGRGQS
jgi:hypothetical protein